MKRSNSNSSTTGSTTSKHSAPSSKKRRANEPSSSFTSAAAPELALWKPSTPLPICEGVTAQWHQTEDYCSIKITVRDQATKLGRYGEQGNRFSRVESGYLLIGNTAATNSHEPPLFLRRFAIGVAPESTQGCVIRAVEEHLSSRSKKRCRASPSTPCLTQKWIPRRSMNTTTLC